MELLWNGGIGTYVKASSETHGHAQDRNNDGLRVDANELRCQVIGEGGNLGMTQLARIEFSQNGGLCYTDAIDNSAGVDTSDHEVNIKILLNAAMENKKLTARQRESTLARMEKEVAHLVLNNNYIQTQILSIEASFGESLQTQQSRAITLLEEKGLLNRELEHLADGNTLQERFESGRYLTRPELAVLLSYSKMDLYQALLDSDLPDSGYLSSEIENYFPKLVAKKYRRLILRHRLKREIISTQITNSLVGSMGPSFHLRLGELTGSNPDCITRAYIAAKDILSIDSIRSQIQALDNKVDACLQMECLNRGSAAMESAIVWLIRNNESEFNIKEVVNQFSKPYQQLCRHIEKSKSTRLSDDVVTITHQYTDKGLPKALAKSIANLILLSHGLDVIGISRHTGQNVQTVCDIYFRLSDELGLNWLQESISSLPATSTWHERARFSLANDLRITHTEIASKVLAGGATLEHWIDQNAQTVSHIKSMSENLKEEQHADFAMLSVLVSELNRLR